MLIIRFRTETALKARPQRFFLISGFFLPPRNVIYISLHKRSNIKKVKKVKRPRNLRKKRTRVKKMTKYSGQ